jgi:hypothetical protein
LPKHVDREQCEFSLTMAIDYTPEPVAECPWPLKLELADGGLATIFQALGDALLYRGRERPHFRDPLPDGHTSTSIFFHYVPEDFDGDLR